MHNIWNRLNTVFFTALFSLALLCTIASLSTYVHTSSPKVNLSFNTMLSLQQYRDQTDKAILTFDLNADLSSVFNWNVKQIFLLLVAEYKSVTNKNNQVVLWDRIVQNADEAKRLKFTNENIEYFLADQFTELRNAEVTLKMMWDIMPVCGRLFMHEKGQDTFQLPTVYMDSDD